MIGAATLMSTAMRNNLLVQAEESVERKATGLVQLWQVVPEGQNAEGASTSQILSELQCRPNHDLYPSGGNAQHATYVNSCYVDDALYLGEDDNYYYIYLAGYEGKVAKTKSHYFNLDLNGDGKSVKYEIQTVAYFIPDGGKAAAVQTASMYRASDEVPLLDFSTDTLVKDFTENVEEELAIATYSDQARNVNGIVQSPSYYANENGTLIHYLTNNVRSTSYSKTIVGKAPSWMKASTRYYSYDGIYFYSDWRDIQVDGTGAVNQKQPFYNYYQYLPFRTTTNYTAAQIDSYTKYYGYSAVPTKYPAATNESKLVGAGKYFNAVQDNYGINGMLQYAMGIHESGWGRSSLSINKNNLFGMNATDNNPYGNGTSFDSVQKGINYHADRYLSWGYTDPLSDARYFGSHVGNKGSGMNVKYASDPFWGEKIAGWYYRIDKYLGLEDYDYYSIGIKQSNDNYNVRNAASTSGSTVYYQTKNGSSNYKIPNYPVVITGTNGSFYRIKTDTPIVNGTPKFSGKYVWADTNAYLSKDAIDVVNHTHYKVPSTATAPAKSNNANLKSLTSDIGTWSPSFNKSTTAYTVTLSEYASQIKLSGSVEDSKASVTSGLGTHNLSVGNNVIEVKTKAEDGTTKTYKVTVVVPKKLSSNANLKTLTASIGTLSPAFSSSVTSYTLTVPGGTKYININGSLADSGASTSAFKQHTVDPDASSNKISIKVKAEDGATKTYTINVKHSSPYYGMSRINSLSFSKNKLQLDGYSYVRKINIPNSSDLIKKLKFTDVKTNKQVKTYVLPNVYNTSLSRHENHGAGVYNYDWAKFDTGLDVSDLPVGEYILKIYTKAGDQKFDVVIPYHSSFQDFSFKLNGKTYQFTTDRTDNTPSIRIIIKKA